MTGGSSCAPPGRRLRLPVTWGSPQMRAGRPPTGRRPQAAAVAAQGLDHPVRSPGEQRADRAAGGEQRPRLAVGHLQALVERHPGPGLERQVGALAPHERARGRHQLPGRGGARRGRALEQDLRGQRQRRLDQTAFAVPERPHRRPGRRSASPSMTSRSGSRSCAPAPGSGPGDSHRAGAPASQPTHGQAARTDLPDAPARGERRPPSSRGVRRRARLSGSRLATVCRIAGSSSAGHRLRARGGSRRSCGHPRRGELRGTRPAPRPARSRRPGRCGRHPPSSRAPVSVQPPRAQPGCAVTGPGRSAAARRGRTWPAAPA